MKNHGHEAQRPDCAAHYEAADINDKLIINFRNLSRTIRSMYEGKSSQKRILILLHETGPITQRELTERIGIQPGSASEVIAKLEKSGWIVRTACGADRRTMDITLTEAGEQAAAEAAEQRCRRHEEMFSCLSAEEKTMLLSLMEKVSGDWDIRYQGAGGRRGRRERGHREGRHHGPADHAEGGEH